MSIKRPERREFGAGSRESETEMLTGARVGRGEGEGGEMESIKGKIMHAKKKYERPRATKRSDK